jgi:hypothetical protein
MNSTNTLLKFLLVLIALFGSAANSFAQGEASGGRVPTTPAKPKDTGASPKTTTTPKRSGALDNISGKWWTTGNDFGASEIMINQNGATISGAITFADGRTGSLNGTLIGKRLQHTWSSSDGNGGSGWLELSWANFLGGPWRNQRVKNGSWTLNRIEGQWCFGGNRSRVRRVTHNAQGRLAIVTEDGTQEQGHMEGPYLFLDLGGQSIKGDMFYKGNRVDFANGFFWTWCGR